MVKKISMIISIFVVMLITNVEAASTLQDAGFTKCTVHATALNIRSGPGTNYSIVNTVKKGTELKAIGRINGWYLVQTDNDVFGMVSGWHITPKTSSSQNTNTSTGTSTTLTADEQEILNLVNNARKEAGLSELKADTELMRVAKIKSQDMVDNNYFAHNSPIYGTPFEMIKNFGISYKSAGENIAGNSTAKKAFDAWMNSSGHKANILGSSYNYTGIGVVNSNKYGKIFTQMFIGR